MGRHKSNWICDCGDNGLPDIHSPSDTWCHICGRCRFKSKYAGIIDIKGLTRKFKVSESAIRRWIAKGLNEREIINKYQ